jgi:adenosylhomocysteine nucleosidase
MIGIIGAMEEEVVMLRSAMADAAETRFGDFVFIEGTLEGKAVVLLRCGIGKVNAAVGCALLIDHFKPTFVINTGSAGGIDPSLTFGDVVVSDGLLYHDVDVTAFGYADGQIPGQKAVFAVGADLISMAERAVDSLKADGSLPSNLRHVRGIIASGDIFMHDAARIASVRSRFPTVRAVEMEGAAIAHACALFQTPVLVIRAISDVAGAESPMKFEEFLPIAAKHSSEIVRRIVAVG